MVMRRVYETRVRTRREESAVLYEGMSWRGNCQSVLFVKVSIEILDLSNNSNYKVDQLFIILRLLLSFIIR